LLAAAIPPKISLRAAVGSRRLALTLRLGGSSCLAHRNIAQIVLVGHVLGVDGVLLEHVPLPVVLPGEGFCALPRVVTPGLGAVKLARLVVLVVVVPLQMRDCAEASLAAWLLAGPRAVMVSTVMTAIMLALCLVARKTLYLLELVERALYGAANIADEPAGRPSW
jgi:hypothetical protein